MAGPPTPTIPGALVFFGGVLFWGGFPFSSSFFLHFFSSSFFLSSCFVGPLLFSLDLFFCLFFMCFVFFCPLVSDFHLILFFLPNSLDALESIARDGSRALLRGTTSREEEVRKKIKCCETLEFKQWVFRPDRLNSLELPALLLSRML